MAFHLFLNFTERFLAARQNIRPISTGMQCPRREGKRQCQSLLFSPLILRKYPFELNQVRLIALQQPAQLIQAACDFDSHGLL